MRIDRRNRLANPNNICRFALPVLPKERSNPTVHTLLTITHHIIRLLAEQLTAAFAAAPKSSIKSNTATPPESATP